MSAAAFRPCVLIPIYDHGSTIYRLARVLSGLAIPIYIVDDGSHEPTRAEIARAAADFRLVRLARLARNSGKGAAVMLGLRLAREHGMTHTLQIDADGQHDAADATRFLERGVARPEALILGQPLFDASVPKARRYGRALTNFWVCVETLSLAVNDTQCGFRLYPLEATCQLIERASLPQRMAFDIAIVVRLAWQGVPVENLPTRVAYPRGGVSHFDLWADNVRISLTHARLVFGMLLRLPQLIARRYLARSSR
jgi:glycosyltransferase involved in cell wall biosynthesis